LFREQFEVTVAAYAYAFGGHTTFSGGVLRVRYIPELRFVLSAQMDQVTAATRSYDLRLKNVVGFDFEYVRGGKLHGLAGGTATPGCSLSDPNGWSIRLIVRANGVPNYTRAGSANVVPTIRPSTLNWPRMFGTALTCTRR
jgi:hypothetical protein